MRAILTSLCLVLSASTQAIAKERVYVAEGTLARAVLLRTLSDADRTKLQRVRVSYVFNDSEVECQQIPNGSFLTTSCKIPIRKQKIRFLNFNYQGSTLYQFNEYNFFRANSCSDLGVPRDCYGGSLEWSSYLGDFELAGGRFALEGAELAFDNRPGATKYSSLVISASDITRAEKRGVKPKMTVDFDEYPSTCESTFPTDCIQAAEYTGISVYEGAIMYTNGILTQKKQALAELRLLCLRAHGPKCPARYYQLNYNSSYGALDLAEAALQLDASQSQTRAVRSVAVAILGGNPVSKGLANLLITASATLTENLSLRATRGVYDDLSSFFGRVVIVGYSQGNLFGNILWDDLNFEERNKTRIVSIATPANNVGGNLAPYTTEKFDQVMSFAGATTVLLGNLPYNQINIDAPHYVPFVDAVRSHSLTQAYLKYSTTRAAIKTNIESALDVDD